MAMVSGTYMYGAGVEWKEGNRLTETNGVLQVNFSAVCRGVPVWCSATAFHVRVTSAPNFRICSLAIHELSTCRQLHTSPGATATQFRPTAPLIGSRPPPSRSPTCDDSTFDDGLNLF